MAKGARASTKKANNQKLKSKVFGPIESARTERLSAKLLELASQPKPKVVQEDVAMEVEAAAEETSTALAKESEAMEVDGVAAKPNTQSKSAGKGRIEKRRISSRRASIVFPRFKEGKKIGKSKSKK